MAERILTREFSALAKEKWVNVELHDDNIFKWDVALVVLNEDSLYYGGYFKATMTFPSNYPYSPPQFRFLVPIYHPNIYPDGKLCISILHPPGEDVMSGESAAERWSPAQRVESVLISILSLLDDAEVSSPANVDAAVMYRTDLDRFRSIVKGNVDATKAHRPADFEMPTSAHEASSREIVEKEDEDFWAESGDDSDPFGGSDSDSDMDMDHFTGSDDDDDDDNDMQDNTS